MKYLFSILSFFLLSSFALAQEDYHENKHYKKMLAHYDKGEYTPATEEMRYVLNEYEQNAKVWEIAIKLYYERYLKAPSNESMMTQQLMEALKQAEKKKGDQTINLTLPNVQEEYFSDLINICREASLKRRDAVSSMYIRVLLIDKNVDTSVTEKAKAYLQEAEENFQKQNFNKALECYDKAIQENPNFYQATLYKGDTYYHLKDYKNAALYYKKAQVMAPNLLEPLKYLTDAYGKDGLYDEALDACIRGITIYPDVAMFYKLSDIAEAQGKKMADPWVRRQCYPNRSFRTTAPATEMPWKAYQEARLKIQPFCDSTGAIVQKNDLTIQPFMETYCWEELLKNTNDPKFDFAKKMQQEGYLDCYVFITMYHFDLQKQYKQFAFNNDQRIKSYITKYLVTQ